MNESRLTAGIDAGSRMIKVVVWDAALGRVAGTAVAEQGVRQAEAAESALASALASAGASRSDVLRVVATGYARGIVAADTTITEITCHARGVHQLLPAARSVVEIGGQDSKLLRLGEGGAVRDFAMNDRCAAGTGRFLEVVASRLGVQLDALGELASRSASPSAISSMCVVFAETEIIGLLASGARPEDIVAGVQVSIASRVGAMAGRSLAGPVAFTGGVALVPGMVAALSRSLGQDVTVCATPMLTGALGAALLAVERA